MKKVILIMSVISALFLVGCNNDAVDKKGDINTPIIEENNGNIADKDTNNIPKQENALNLTDEVIIKVLELNFDDTLENETRLHDLSVIIDENGTEINFKDSLESKIVKIKGVTGRIKSMKYMLTPQLIMQGELLLLTEQGDVYIVSDYIVDEQNEEIVKEYVMKKIETPHKIEKIAGYEFGSNGYISIPVLRYENGNYGIIREGKVENFDLMRECVVKDLLCGDYKTEKVIKNNEEVVINDSLNIRVTIGSTSAENDFGLAMRYENVGDLFYTTNELDLVIDSQNNVLKQPSEVYNETNLKFEDFKFEINNDTLEVSLKAYISAPENIVIEFKKV